MNNGIFFEFRDFVPKHISRTVKTPKFMKKIFGLTLALACLYGAHAQSLDSVKISSIDLQKDPRVDLLVRKQAELNEEAFKNSRHTMPGFRVQVINTNDRGQAMTIKTKLLQEFPEEKTYFLYQSPYFKIQIGNCRTRPEAENLFKKVKKLYPSGSLIIPATIEVRGDAALDTGDLQN